MSTKRQKLSNESTLLKEKLSNESTLLKASKDGDLKKVKYLLKTDVDVNCSKNYGTRQGWTPLHRSCYYGHVKIVKSLLACEAKIFPNMGSPFYILLVVLLRSIWLTGF